MPKTQVLKKLPRVRTKNTRRMKPRVVRESRMRYATNAAPRPPDPIIATELPRAVERIANALRPEKIILFGSHAYGKPTWDSDVDLLVIWDTDASHNERHLAVARFLRPRLFALDLLVRTPKEINDGLNKGDFFLREITTQGKVLYERRD